MKVAGIDIGTNSMRLLLADYLPNPDENQYEFRNRSKETQITRMGKGVNENKIIEPTTFSSNLESFENFVATAKTEKAEHIFAIGTSALRDAKNGDDFVAMAEKNTGIRINIISGSFEAELGFYGVSQGVKDNGRILIIDIGGGSTEFVVGSQIEGVVFKKSLDIGAVRMTDRFGEDFQQMHHFIMSQIEVIWDLIIRYEVKQVVGIGGTITTVSAINQSLATYDWNKVHNSKVSIQDVAYIFKSLSALTVEERKKVIGLQPGRADIIVAGINILLSIMQTFHLDNITVSEYDNLEGLIYYYLRDI